MYICLFIYLGTSVRITQLEHVHAIVTIKHVQRGKLNITLMAPSGITAPLLKNRANDTSTDGFKSWAFLSVFNWGEDPSGYWKLIIYDSGQSMTNSDSGKQSSGTLVSWYLKFYGTCNMKNMS